MSTLFDMDEVPVASTKSNEWFTPSRYIEAARAVMGGIDLDPASCEMANQVVQATRYYTKENNGLDQEWHGRVWLNPPYGRLDPTKTGSTRSLQKFFIQKLLHEYTLEHVKQAIALVLGNACFMQWFQPLWGYSLCFHAGHIPFWRPDGSTSDFGFGTIFVYLGPHEQKFTEVFSKFGRIVRAIDTRPSPVTQPSLF